jgi:hypothetical protein
LNQVFRIVSSIQTCACVLVIAFGLLGSSPAVIAQSDATPEPPPDTPDEVDQRYTSLQVDVYSKYFKILEEDDWSMRLRLKAAAGVYKYESFDDFLNPEIDHLQSVGIRPRLEFQFPLSVENLSFVPNIELAWNHMLDDDRDLLSGSAAVGLQYLKTGDQKDFYTKLEAKYGTRYLEDGQNLDDYLELSLTGELRRAIQLGTGSRKLSLTPIGKISNFIDDLQFIADNGALLIVDWRYEVGFRINTSPKLRIGTINIPDLRISYIFGDDFKGINIRL